MPDTPSLNQASPPETGSRRPALVLSWMDGLAPLRAAHREALDAVADVLDWEPISDYRTPRATELLAEAEIMLGHWGTPTIDADTVALMPNLRLLAYGAGTVKWVVTEAVYAKGIEVTSAAPANAVPVAEFTLGAILLANKAAFLSRDLTRDPASWTDGLRLPKPSNVGKRVGLIGASLVGRLVIDLLRPFDLEVVVYDPFLTVQEASQLGVEKVELDVLLATSHVVSLHAPALPSTEKMLGADEFAAMADGTTFINTARGMIVDHEAMQTELVSGRISAVLDVTDPHEPIPPDSPLLRLPNVFLTPHIAGAQGREVDRLTSLAIEEVARYCRGEGTLHPVRQADLDRIA